MREKAPSQTVAAHAGQSPLWAKALERYREELKDCEDYESILEVDSVEELLNQAKALRPPGALNKTTASSLNRLEPILNHLNDFSAVIALCFGADAKIAALVWGSIRIILTLASPAGDTLRDILNMLEELSLTLPKFRAYEQTLPMDEALESALLDVYTEMTCFCARTINFFRSNPHQILRRNLWADFDSDFQRTIKRLKRLSQMVESEADAARMRVDAVRNSEILELMQTLKESKIHHDKLPCYYIPFGINERFYGREAALQAVKEALDPRPGEAAPRSFALHGMGGVGKTQIVLQYANSSRGSFDAILWISADNSIRMAQSFLEIARRLGLFPENEEAQDAVAAMLRVKSWLADACCKWLLIFDNADDLEILKHAWPGSATGSILLTTRDFNAAFSPAGGGYHVLPFDDTAGSSAFLSLVGRDPQASANISMARDIAHTLGGLPLAISQISGFIVQQKLALEDFLPLYERNAAKIHARKGGISDYEHTLSTVWEIALSKLTGDASKIQKLLAFFDPDKVHESVLQEGFIDETEDSEFYFLADEMDFLDAKEALLRAALIERSAEDASLSIHRLVQAAVMTRLSAEEKIVFVDKVIHVLGKGFPDTWREDVGHQFKAWSRCEKCLPHVSFLVKQCSKYKLHPTDPEAFAEMILRCCWYLYEREYYDRAQELMHVALQNFRKKDTLAYASAIDLLGLIQLDTNNLHKALETFFEALRIREELLGPDDAFIASSLNNVGLAYTELGELEKAYESHQKAIEIRLRTKSDRIGNSYSNMSSLLLRMGKPDEAEAMLGKCPSLKDFNDDTFLSTGNPRFSGDMVLLSRIRAQQGRLDDALRLSSKALAFRQQMLGNRLKTCDSLYLVASFLQKRGNVPSAISLLTECTDISASIPEASGHLARANYKLYQIYASLGNVEQSEACKKVAHDVRTKIMGQETESTKGGDGDGDEDGEEAFERLVLWMLW